MQCAFLHTSSSLYLHLALQRKYQSCHKASRLWKFGFRVQLPSYKLVLQKVPNDISVNSLHFTKYMPMCEQFPICVRRTCWNVKELENNVNFPSQRYKSHIHPPTQRGPFFVQKVSISLSMKKRRKKLPRFLRFYMQ